MGSQPPLGPRFRGLWAAAASSHLGAGLTQTAMPLLAALLTRSPALVAGVAVANRLPWLVFAMHAGALADRHDRRWLMMGANLLAVPASSPWRCWCGAALQRWPRCTRWR